MLSCALCSLACPKDPVVEDEKPFCCAGCLTVFRILGAQEIEGDFTAHPLYKQALASGIISNPDSYAEEKTVEGEVQTLHLEIGEMWCPSCAEAIRMILMRQKGVRRCVVDYATDLALIEFSPLIHSKEDLTGLISKMGYTPRSLLAEDRKPARSLWVRFAVSAFCALNLMMLALPIYTKQFTEGYGEAASLLSFALALPLITYGAWPLWRRFYVSLRTGIFGMETLVLLAASTAFVFSTAHLFARDPNSLYYDSMGMLLTFVLLGKILEKRAKFSAKESLFRATRTLPKKGFKRLASGEYVSVPIKEIRIGDRILARTGEKVVLDGIVAEGEGLVDASVMTGEAMPVRVKPGSKLVGGSIVKQGILHIEVSADVEQSVLAKISAVIEYDLGRKCRPQRIVDKIIPFFVPVVILLACAAFPFGSIFRTLSVLLISCPCAIGIAAPLAESRLIFRFAEMGALVRNRASLAILAQNPLFAFDKTGTLTEGKFRVLNNPELSELHKAILKGLTEQTTHPAAAAIGEALSRSIPLQHVKEVIGRGMEAAYAGKTYRLGSAAFMRESGIDAPSTTKTAVHFAEENSLLATILLGDRLRPDIPKVEGVILSGDSPELVSEIARACGFRWGKGGCDPLQKRAEIEKLEKPVAMVGDGMNDAPALSAADIGISVVTATDLSIEVSDILLTKSSLAALPKLVAIAKKGQTIIRQNLAWSFLYNAIGLGLAMAGLLTPIFAVAAMLLSSLCVTLNSMRT